MEIHFNTSTGTAMRLDGAFAPPTESKHAGLQLQKQMKEPSGAHLSRIIDSRHKLHLPMHSVLISGFPTVVENCDTSTGLHSARFSSPTPTAGVSITDTSHGHVMPMQTLQTYSCNVTNKPSMIPPAGRPLAGPPQLVNMLPFNQAVARRITCQTKGQSPTTIIYGEQSPAAFASTESSAYREMSADEQLFVEAAAALSHAESSDQSPVVAKKPQPRIVGIPPPPFKLRQMRDR
ncbi:hypothetical protein MPSEU_000722500 [Mayamaea pseudoterrestris]|nr:hypothetical protein MPSEU_000722500 [Mayamaea pseudoterrestris]